MAQESSLLKEKTQVVFGSFSDHTIAVIQWLHERRTMLNVTSTVYVVTVNTGWSSKAWALRTHSALQWCESLGMTPVVLDAPVDFESAVLARTRFPTAKFQWCASMLKGLPFLQWLNEVDPQNETVIIQGTNPSTLGAQVERIKDECEFHGDRSMFRPLNNSSPEALEALIMKTPFTVDRHWRSQECQPCVKCSKATLHQTGYDDLIKVQELENRLRLNWYNQPVDGKNTLYQQMTERMMASSETQKLYAGCSDPYACGM